MPYETFNEIHDRNFFRDKDIIFVSVVMKCDKVTVIMIDSGGGNHRSAKIAADLFRDRFGITFVWFCINIETIFLVAIAGSFCFSERITDSGVHFIQKRSLEGITK